MIRILSISVRSIKRISHFALKLAFTSCLLRLFFGLALSSATEPYFKDSAALDVIYLETS